MTPTSHSVTPSILETVKSFLTADRWSFVPLEDQSILKLGFQGHQGEWLCFAHIKEEQQQFLFYSLAPLTVPEEKRGAIAEFITRANYGLLIGNFELDLEDGEVRFKTSIDVEGSQIDEALVKRLIYTNVLMMDQYLPGILAVLNQGVSPKIAIAAIET